MSDDPENKMGAQEKAAWASWAKIAPCGCNDMELSKDFRTGEISCKHKEWTTQEIYDYSKRGPGLPAEGSIDGVVPVPGPTFRIVLEPTNRIIGEGYYRPLTYDAMGTMIGWVLGQLESRYHLHVHRLTIEALHSLTVELFMDELERAIAATPEELRKMAGPDTPLKKWANHFVSTLCSEWIEKEQ